MKKAALDYAYYQARRKEVDELEKMNNKKKNKKEEKNKEEKIEIENISLESSKPKMDITVEKVNIEDERVIEKNGVTLTCVGSKILDTHLHYVLSRDITYSEFLNGKSQIYVPSGYRLVSLNRDDSLINNNYAVFENIKPVKVKVYKTDDGKEVLPEFGEPIV